jgi:hypothetical protein
MGLPMRAVVALGCVSGALGCSPTFDWRTVQPEDSALQAMFPCRPLVDRRQLPLAGQPARMTLLACQAGGLTFAVEHADIADPGRIAEVLTALQRSTEGRIVLTQAHRKPGQVPGMTPQPASVMAHLEGKLPDGRPVQVASVVFAHGTRVYQAFIWGAAIEEGVEHTFFEGLRIRPGA